MQITIQDGEDAGQTIEHCHIHLIPTNKKILIEDLDKISNNILIYLIVRKDRTFEEMSKEAKIYQEVFLLN